MSHVTWKQFKERVEGAGVDDESIIEYIDVQPLSLKGIEVEITPDEGVPGAEGYRPETFTITN